MKQEEKELLLKDLSGRSPYGVKVEYFDRRIGDFCVDVLGSVYPLDEHVFIGRLPFNFDFDEIYLEDNLVDIENVKPYLFPLSSMTKEQIEEYRKVCELDTEMLSKHPMDGSPFPAMYNSQDSLDKNHFDYRGLIPMGLAIDATGKNIY
jgi:hypothetical protein